VSEYSTADLFLAKPLLYSARSIITAAMPLSLLTDLYSFTLSLTIPFIIEVLKKDLEGILVTNVV
jgi:hypothetical protein